MVEAKIWSQTLRFPLWGPYIVGFVCFQQMLDKKIQWTLRLYSGESWGFPRRTHHRLFNTDRLPLKCRKKSKLVIWPTNMKSTFQVKFFVSLCTLLLHSLMSTLAPGVHRRSYFEPLRFQLCLWIVVAFLLLRPTTDDNEWSEYLATTLQLLVATIPGIIVVPRCASVRAL